jgi:uncharacterized protein with von Willebrand factor type A (vWA) domain
MRKPTKSDEYATATMAAATMTAMTTATIKATMMMMTARKPSARCQPSTGTVRSFKSDGAPATITTTTTVSFCHEYSIIILLF